MKKLALVLGLTSMLLLHVFLPLFGSGFFWLELELPYQLVCLGSIAAGFFTAWR